MPLHTRIDDGATVEAERYDASPISLRRIAALIGQDTDTVSQVRRAEGWSIGMQVVKSKTGWDVVGADEFRAWYRAK